MKFAFILLILSACGFAIARLKKDDTWVLKLDISLFALAFILIMLGFWDSMVAFTGTIIQIVALALGMVVGIQRKSSLIAMMCAFPMLFWIFNLSRWPGTAALLYMNIVTVLIFILMIKGRKLYPRELGLISIVGLISLAALFLYLFPA